MSRRWTAYTAAFCCGSNSITRRSAIESIGGGLPTGSLTEDMLLTLALLREGFVTRYLNEHLAIGLAPESLAAMYVQRARWARGAIQMLYLREGRGEESFDIDTPCRVASGPGRGSAGRIETISLTEARIRTAAEDELPHDTRWLRIDIPQIGSVAAFVRRQNGRTIEAALLLPQGKRRDALLRKLFTSGMDNSTHTDSALRIVLKMVSRIAFGTKRTPALRTSGEVPPDWLADEIAALAGEKMIDDNCEKSCRKIL